MRKMLLIIVMTLLLTGCGSVKAGDIYEDTVNINKVINDKILSDSGCIGVESYYNGNADASKFSKSVTTCENGLEEFKGMIGGLDKKAKKLENSNLKEKWTSVKENYDKEIDTIEKIIEVFNSWEQYTECYNSKMITEGEILKCLEPMFDLKYSAIDKVLKDWAPLKSNMQKIHNEFLSYKYGSDERNSLEPKLEEARKVLEDYEKENGIYDNGNRLDFRKLLVKVFDIDEEYGKVSMMVRYGMEKIDFDSFYYDVRSICLDEKDERCANN